jgi:hypothetical protein
MLQKIPERTRIWPRSACLVNLHVAEKLIILVLHSTVSISRFTCIHACLLWH